MGQKVNQENKTLKLKENEVINISKHMGHNEGNSRRKGHSTKCLHQKIIGQISY